MQCSQLGVHWSHWKSQWSSSTCCQKGLQHIQRSALKASYSRRLIFTKSYHGHHSKRRQRRRVRFFCSRIRCSKSSLYVRVASILRVVVSRLHNLPRSHVRQRQSTFLLLYFFHRSNSKSVFYVLSTNTAPHGCPPCALPAPMAHGPPRPAARLHTDWAPFYDIGTNITIC